MNVKKEVSPSASVKKIEVIVSFRFGEKCFVHESRYNIYSF